MSSSSTRNYVGKDGEEESGNARVIPIGDGDDDGDDDNDDEIDTESAKRRPRKSIDVKNNGLSTDGLRIIINRYTTNVRFIESIQTGQAKDRSLLTELRGQTASQIYTRTSKHDSFTEAHVDDEIMATFSTVRDYRAACDMERMDPDRFRRVVDLFVAWNEPQCEEFKRNYILEYVFRLILQRDSVYRNKYTHFLKQCQESIDYSTIDRPLLPLPTPKFMVSNEQIELCNSSLRSKLRSMQKRKRGKQDESQMYLARLGEAVDSFFQQLGLVDESNWPVESSPSSMAQNVTTNVEKKESSISRKRPSATIFSFGSGKRRSEANARAITTVPTTTLAKAVLRKVFKGNRNRMAAEEMSDLNPFAQSNPGYESADEMVSLSMSSRRQLYQNLSFQTDGSLPVFGKGNSSRGGINLDDDAQSIGNNSTALIGVGADEPMDEDDLRSILNDLTGMHAVVTCELFGRILEHGSIRHPDWGMILVRHGRVVRLGTAERGFRAPAPDIEFQFPMEQLPDFVQVEKIRFDDQRNLYLNGFLTDFYFLQGQTVSGR